MKHGIARALRRTALVTKRLALTEAEKAEADFFLAAIDQAERQWEGAPTAVNFATQAKAAAAQGEEAPQ